MYACLQYHAASSSSPPSPLNGSNGGGVGILIGHCGNGLNYGSTSSGSGSSGGSGGGNGDRSSSSVGSSPLSGSSGGNNGSAGSAVQGPFAMSSAQLCAHAVVLPCGADADVIARRDGVTLSRIPPSPPQVRREMHPCCACMLRVRASFLVRSFRGCRACAASAAVAAAAARSLAACPSSAVAAAQSKF